MLIVVVIEEWPRTFWRTSADSPDSIQSVAKDAVSKTSHKYMVEGLVAPLRNSYPDGLYEMSSKPLGAG